MLDRADQGSIDINDGIKRGDQRIDPGRTDLFGDDDMARGPTVADALSHSRSSRYACIHHVDFLVVGIARDFPTDPNWKRKLGRLRRKLNFSQDYASQYPLVDIDLPRKLSVRDEVSGLCKLSHEGNGGRSTPRHRLGGFHTQILHWPSLPSSPSRPKWLADHKSSHAPCGHWRLRSARP